MTDTTILAAAPRQAPQPRTAPKGAGFEGFFEYLCCAAATMLLITLGGILVSLLIGGWPAFAKFGFSFFVTSNWDPVQGVFGIAALIVDTVAVALLALLMAVPIVVRRRLLPGRALPLLPAPADRHRRRAPGRHPVDRLRHVGPLRLRAALRQLRRAAADERRPAGLDLGQAHARGAERHRHPRRLDHRGHHDPAVHRRDAARAA